MNLAELSIKRPIFITCVVALMIVVGLVSFKNLPVDQFPDQFQPDGGRVREQIEEWPLRRRLRNELKIQVRERIFENPIGDSLRENSASVGFTLDISECAPAEQLTCEQSAPASRKE